MRVLSDKYIAGFLDSDGSIYIDRNKKLWMEFIQKLSNDGVIERIHQAIGKGSMLVCKSKRRGVVGYSRRIKLHGQPAIDILCRLKPFMVTKRRKANSFLRELGFIERISTDSIPTHPSRSWLSGYFDGDGCIYACANKHGGTASVKVSIDSNTDETAGLELVKKAFGGVIETRGNGNNIRWTLRLDAAKAIKFLSYIAPRLLIKREQAHFVLACATMGHFRDGETIARILRDMKTHPHRLNDLTSEVDISSYYAMVRDLPATDGHRYRHYDGQVCLVCGSEKYYAKGKCKNCWQNERYHAAKGEATVGTTLL
jgi:hypothetical protein